LIIYFKSTIVLAPLTRQRLYSPAMKFEITHRDSDTAARCGVMATDHGLVNTPVFMPVGTQGSVKAMHPSVLKELGAEIILGNTYHLSMRPGVDLIKSLGGLHKFIGWEGAILTDSGGFQIYSMSGRHKVTEEGVSFQSHLDGSKNFMSPEDCVRIQVAFGSDIIMILDHCLPYPSSPGMVREAMELTCRWAERSAALHSSCGSNLALFAIQQGGFDRLLREKCSERLVEMGFDGFAVGGLSVGEPRDLFTEAAYFSVGMLPQGTPRYLMGVGPPEDLLEMIGYGYDMFDCVMPTRSGRTGLLFTSRGKLVIKHNRFRDDPDPIDPECRCSVCQKFSRAYLRHLFVSGEILGAMLNTHHNLHFFLDMMRQARTSIAEGKFESYRKSFLARFSEGI
jgi:queuine tRNA-ribosyltransferase